ncbi:MAG: tRNA (N(6)-L-threonylcarbamoyladenosine(37)-C(2))-methylthiotransferase MtaB [Lachnospiraceae bacterium]|nr:tRNA (N(6)-L-threonylcarbamoyladenosine(37)-C(2))-methylthiotransferase MtaB [Lachnospiraceae bacterium]
MSKKIALHNLGCKVNAYETESMRQTLERAGYEIVPFAPGADAYIINTCTVTDVADKKSRQMLHKAKKMNPQAIVVAVGCYVQTGGQKLAEDDMVDLLVGNSEKAQIADILKRRWQESRKREYVQDMKNIRAYAEMECAGGMALEHVRANIKVQDGCNQFCSYCVIPYARGRVRSRRPDDVLKEVANLAAQGYQEIVLTGIHLSSYGVDFQDERIGLLDLIRLIHQEPGIARIRLGSLEPGIVTREFAAGLSSLPKVCPHFHLSLQSGSDSVLKRMNRKYTAQDYRMRTEILREYFEDPALTTDVMVGFPGESEEEFQESYEFVREVGFYETHIFQYSRRAGTGAAAMDGQISRQVKQCRSRQLLDLHERQSRKYEDRRLHRQAELLIEEMTETESGEIYLLGHTREYVKAALVGRNSGDWVNRRVQVELLEPFGPHVLLCREWEE